MKGKKTGGRKPGSKNKETLQLKEILDSTVDFSVVAQKLYELTQGVTVQKETQDGPRIYEEKPDAYAARTLIEFRYGKPKQQIEQHNTGEMTFAPQIILNPKKK